VEVLRVWASIVPALELAEEALDSQVQLSRVCKTAIGDDSISVEVIWTSSGGFGTSRSASEGSPASCSDLARQILPLCEMSVIHLL
jgi:hypothetical protein